MSAARSQFLSDLSGLRSAVSLEPVSTGATQTREANGTLILRRGILIAALIALETFIRTRVTELLQQLGRWPARFQDLPQDLRDAALLNALSNLQRYAAMLKRQKEDYEAEIIEQIEKMSANTGPGFEFTKFVSGDHTGNISDSSVKNLLSIFQVKGCWNSFRLFSSDIGFGVPSIEEILKDVVRKRHRSAHSAGFAPTAADISGLAGNLLCLGVCFDTSMTSTIEQALADWRKWSAGTCSWRDAVDLYILDRHGGRFRLTKHGRRKALKIIDNIDIAQALLPRPHPGHTGILIVKDATGRPESWSIL